MLSLNPLLDNHVASRAQAETKRKAPSQGDERGGRADFGSYLAAMAQPMKPEPRMEAPAIKTDAPQTEKSQPHQNNIPAQNTEAQAQTSAQKAGHEAASESQALSAAKEPKESGEVAEARAAKTPAMRAEKELLETFGIALKKQSSPVTAGAKFTAGARTENTTAPAKTEQSKASSTAKSQTAAHILTQLDKIPDLVLGSSDGLKRLSEKLGVAFLGKVSEKLKETQNKAESSTTQLRAEARTDHTITTTTARAQKAGDGSAQQGFDAQSNSKSARNFTARNVSRETLATDATEKLPVLGGSDLKPVSMPETQTARNNTIHTEIRLADPVTSTRGTDAVRVAVENPAMRTDLLRQMSEVMTRAQVLVTDNQNAQFSVKLYPRELGRMEIDLKLVDGEIKGKIVVESEEVKNEMQNFLQNRDNGTSGQDVDLNRIDIEVRSGNQNAQNPERTPDADALIKNLVTRTAASVYEAPDLNASSGNALYA